MLKSFGISLEAGVRQCSLEKLQEVWRLSNIRYGMGQCRCNRGCYINTFVFNDFSYPRDIETMKECILYIYNKFEVMDANETMGVKVRLFPAPLLSYKDFEKIVEQFKNRHWYSGVQRYQRVHSRDEWEKSPTSKDDCWLNFCSIFKDNALEVNILPMFQDPFELIDEIIFLLKIFEKFPTEIEYKITKELIRKINLEDKVISVKCKLTGEGGDGAIDVVLPSNQNELNIDKIVSELKRRYWLCYTRENMICKDITYVNRENMEQQLNEFFAAVLDAIEALYLPIEYKPEEITIITTK